MTLFCNEHASIWLKRKYAFIFKFASSNNWQKPFTATICCTDKNVKILKNKVNIWHKSFDFSVVLHSLYTSKMRQIASTFFKNFPGVSPRNPALFYEPLLGYHPTFGYPPPPLLSRKCERRSTVSQNKPANLGNHVVYPRFQRKHKIGAGRRSMLYFEQLADRSWVKSRDASLSQTSNSATLVLLKRSFVRSCQNPVALIHFLWTFSWRFFQRFHGTSSTCATPPFRTDAYYWVRVMHSSHKNF